MTDFPPGIVILPRGDVLRYSISERSRMALKVPNGSWKMPEEGTSVARVKNRAIRMAFQSQDWQWMWQMGEDHTFHPDILLRLLARMFGENLPVVGVLSYKRKPPFVPVVYKEPGDKPGFYRRYRPDEMPTSGLWTVFNCSTAGMLVRRDVLEKIGDPWFVLGRTTPDAQGEDLVFVDTFRELGFPPVIDLDIPGIDSAGRTQPNRRGTGHVTPVSVWPCVLDDGTWGIELDLDYGFGVRMPFPAGMTGEPKVEVVQGGEV